MGNPNLADHNKATRFKPGKSGNPNGRPPSWISRAAKKYRVSRSELADALNDLMFHRSGAELARMRKNFLDESNKNPSFMGACASGILMDAKRGDMRALGFMAGFLFDKEEASAGGGMTDGERREFLLYKIYRKLHPKQQAVWNDPSRQKMICMPRRWGKTFLVFSQMVAACMEGEHSRVLYVGRSIKEAEKQFNEMKLDWLYRMGFPLDTDLKGLFPEGSWIDTYGLGPGADGDPIRGRKYKLIVFDEFFHLREDYLEYFMNQVLGPMQRDYADWREIRVGTVPENDYTFGGQEWKEAMLGRSAWKVYTTHDPDENPNISAFAPWFAEKYPNVDPEEPWVQREYFCKWVFDTQAQLFPEWHAYEKGAPPYLDVTHVLIGGDFGHNHDSAVAAVAWDNNLKNGYVFFEETFNKDTVPKGRGTQEYMDEVCGRAWERAIDLIGINNLSRIIWRFDSANPADIQRLKRNVRARQLPASAAIKIVGAYKHQAEYMHGEMRAMLKSGDLLVPRDGPLEKEMRQTIYVRDEATGMITNELDDRFHPNIIPALRYALEYVLLKKIGINVNALAKGARR